MKSPGVLVIGEALIDIVEAPSGAVAEAPGGSPLNVAVTLGRLGVPVTLATALGDDERADRIQAHLTASGVALAAGARTLDRTASARARMQSDGSALYDLDVTWDPATPDPGSAKAIHAGSIALFQEPGASRVGDFLRRAPAGAMVSLDPNIRPSLLPGRRHVVAHFEQLAALAHLVKLSDEDAAWLYPDLTWRQVAQHLLRLGPTLVVVTRGGQGSHLAAAGITVDRPAVTSVIADTIGAGDSFMGALIRQALALGVIDRLVSRSALGSHDLVTLGDAAGLVAAVTVSRVGADPPWDWEIDATLTE